MDSSTVTANPPERSREPRLQRAPKDSDHAHERGNDAEAKDKWKIFKLTYLVSCPPDVRTYFPVGLGVGKKANVQRRICAVH